MKKKAILNFILLMVLQVSILQSTYITFSHYGGRFGDHLLQYIKAKWFSKKYGIPFLLRKFEFSSELQLHYAERHQDAPEFKHKRRQYLQAESILANSLKKRNQIFEIDYRCDFDAWYQKPDRWREILSDTSFIDYMKTMIKPIKGLIPLNIPEDCISVAVHIRKGGGKDVPGISQQEYDVTQLTEQPRVMPRDKFTDWIYPLKFLPHQYFIDQIKRLSELLGDFPLYIYVFTDDQNPAALCKLLQQKVGKSNIIYDCRQKNKHHSRNVVEDFFAMAYQFDCLIRGGSHLSLVADFVGSHKLVIRPIEAYWFGNKLVVTKTDTVAKDPDFVELFGIADQCTDGMNSMLMT